MKPYRRLSPSLAEIERRLFGASAALMAAVDRNETSPAIADSVRRSQEWAERSGTGAVQDESVDQGEVPPEQLPDWIHELIQRRVRVAEAFGRGTPMAPEPGLIVEVREIRTPRARQLDWVMQVPLYVLLDAVAEDASIWHGWLTSSEVDYAGWWDFVLQEQDGQFDPEAGVVQLWNPVRIYWPMAGRAVGRLSPARMQAVRALAAEYLTTEPPSDIPVWPGRVAERRTLGGLSVVTGSPLGGNEDPRHRYQHIYFHAGEAIREPARIALAASTGTQDSPTIARLKALFDRLLAQSALLGQQLVGVPSDLPSGVSGSRSGSLTGALLAVLEDRASPLVHAMLSKRIGPSRSAIAAMLGSGPITPRVDADRLAADLLDEGVGHLFGAALDEVSMDSMEIRSPEVQDLQWRGLVRISLVESLGDGSGKMELAAIGAQSVTCGLLVEKAMEGAITLQPGEPRHPLEWHGGKPTALVLVAADGQRLELQLSEERRSDASAEPASGSDGHLSSATASQFTPVDNEATRNHIRALGKGIVAPANGRERHFLKVLAGEARPSSPGERAWLEYWRTQSDDAGD